MVEDLVDDLMVVIMMKKRIRMRLEVEVKIRGEKISIISMIRTIEIREEEVEDKDLEEETSMGNVFTIEKDIENLNSRSSRKGRLKNKRPGEICTY